LFLQTAWRGLAVDSPTLLVRLGGEAVLEVNKKGHAHIFKLIDYRFLLRFSNNFIGLKQEL